MASRSPTRCAHPPCSTTFHPYRYPNSSPNCLPIRRHPSPTHPQPPHYQQPSLHPPPPPNPHPPTITPPLGAAQRPPRCCLRFGAAKRPPRWGSVARRKPSGALWPSLRRSEAFAAVRFGGEVEAERCGSARRGSAQRSVPPLSAYLQAPVYQQNKNFYVFQHKKVAKIFGQFAKNA